MNLLFNQLFFFYERLFYTKTIDDHPFFIPCIWIRHKYTIFPRNNRIKREQIRTLSIPFCLVFNQLFCSGRTSLESIYLSNFTSSFIFLHFKLNQLNKCIGICIIIRTSYDQPIGTIRFCNTGRSIPFYMNTSFYGSVDF